MAIIEVNWIAVIVSAVIFMVVGSLWYSPMLFGKTWMKAKGFQPEEMKGGGQIYLFAFINALLISFVLAHFIHYTGAATAVDGMCVAFWAWLGFTVTAHLSSVLWERQPVTVFLIHIFGMLVSMLTAGAVLASL